MFFTRKGDKGKTKLNCKIVSKASKRIEVLASIDLLDSLLGLISCFATKKTKKEIEEIQKMLYLLMTEIALNKKKITKKEIKLIEKKCIEKEKFIGKINYFVLPQGTKSAALLHIARALTRKLETKIVKLKPKNNNIIAFINRLSSLFFLMALTENKKMKVKEKKASA